MGQLVSPIIPQPDEPKAQRRPRKQCALNLRITDETRAALDSQASRTRQSRAAVAEDWMVKGRFWDAFQRQVIAESEGLPTAEEIKAAIRTLQAAQRVA